MSELTPQQERFCREYVVDLSVTKAAQRAGYSLKNAPQQGSRLLKNPHAAALVSKLHQDKMQRIDIRADNVLKELGQIAFTDVRSLFDQNGNMVPIQDLDDQAASSIASFELAQNADGTTRVSRLRTWDKVRALEQLCKHLGLLAPDQVNHLHQVVHFAPEQLEIMSDAQLSRVEQAYTVLRDVSAELVDSPPKRLAGHLNASNT